MLFNSYQFIAVFFPVTLLGYYLFAKVEHLRLGWLLLTSICFYGYWDIRFLPLLLGSIVFNWLLSRRLNPTNRHWLIAIGVGFNLLLIGIFKYLDFFAGSLYYLVDEPFSAYALVLPLGISFFTFQQISYLVDRSRGDTHSYPLLHYSLYVIFFPQLIAGPIVRHNEIIPQFKKTPLRPDIYHHIGAGLLLFTLGLIKKTLLADRLAETATVLFDRAAIGDVLTFGESWAASTSYSLQLYFDFSGYSDMAIGLALMMGFTLPINFNAPYRAASIQEFWRRWHMTLSRFLRDYLYIPLGGNRHGVNRLLIALMLTMLLGGLWHGAGWTFVIWGSLHGVALVINRVWGSKGLAMSWTLGWTFTLMFLLFSWVVFRADSISTAWSIWQSMLGIHSMDLTISDPEDGWFGLAAFLVAVVGPTSHVIALRKLKPRVGYALLTAGLLFYLTLNVASDGYTEFLYFQF